jgi:Fur family transcriptional regulator, peroxide stress response regulator
MMKTIVIAQRQTKYCQAIESMLETLGHATNAELLRSLREVYPDVSATTVHRATARLASRGSISQAPPAADGSMRYDANTTPHDHFMCRKCGVLRDTDVKDKVVPILEASIGGDCHISGRITISGVCKKCKEVL